MSVRLRLPGPGALVLTASGKSSKRGKYKAKTIRNAGSARRASAGGVTVLSFTPRPPVKSALKHGQRVKLTIKITFTPTGGSARAVTKALTLLPTRSS